MYILHINAPQLTKHKAVHDKSTCLTHQSHLDSRSSAWELSFCCCYPSE